MGQTISICSQKGGVGKTTTLINLGFALAERGKRVVLLDTDPQNALAFSMGYAGDEAVGVADLLAGNATLPEVVLPSQHGNLKLIPAGQHSLQLDDGLTAAGLLQSLEPLLKLADFLLVDTQAGLAAPVREVLKVSDATIVPVNPTALSLMTLPSTLEIIGQLRDSGRGRPNLLGVILNGIDTRSQAQMGVLNQVLGTIPRHLLFDSMIPFTDVIQESAAQATPLLARPTERRSASTQAYRQMAMEFIGRLEAMGLA